MGRGTPRNANIRTDCGSAKRETIRGIIYEKIIKNKRGVNNMGGYGLTPEEMHTNLQAYNHPLFRNMAYFTDLVWEINITTDTVYVMKNCLISGINKRETPISEKCS